MHMMLLRLQKYFFISLSASFQCIMGRFIVRYMFIELLKYRRSEHGNTVVQRWYIMVLLYVEWYGLITIFKFGIIHFLMFLKEVS